MKRYSVEDRLLKTRFEIYKEPHIIVDTSKCRECLNKPCIKICPAGLYSLDEDGNLIFNYEGCLECGSCRLICPYNNIRWNTPPGGYGVDYSFG